MILPPARFLLSLLLGLGLAVASLPAQDTPIPPDIARLLAAADAKRKEAMNGRFGPILSDIQQRSGDSKQFYLDAIQQLQFSKGTSPQKDFSDWKLKNKELLDDPRLPVAADIHLLYLRGQINHAKGSDPAAMACFNSLLAAVRGGPPDLLGYRFMKEGLTETVFFKFYELEEGYFKEKDGYYGNPGDVEKLFTGMMEPWYQDNDPKSLGAEWDLMIAAVDQASQVTDKSADNYSLVDHPRLLVLKADSLVKAGQKTEAIETLKQVIQKFPAYPEYKGVADKLVQWASGKFPAPAPPAGN